MDGTEPLNRRQQALIPYLLSLPIEQAAKAAKVSRSVAFRWLKEPAFRAALRLTQDEAFEDAIGLLKSNVEKASRRLVGLIDSDDQQIALRASSLVIEHAGKLGAFADVADRVSEIERRLELAGK